MSTEWKVEGKGSDAKVVASCPVCHTVMTFHGDPMMVVKQSFKHNLCKGLVETIPTDVRDRYWERAVISQS